MSRMPTIERQDADHGRTSDQPDDHEQRHPVMQLPDPGRAARGARSSEQ